MTSGNIQPVHTQHMPMHVHLNRSISRYERFTFLAQSEKKSIQLRYLYLKINIMDKQLIIELDYILYGASTDLNLNLTLSLMI